MLPFIRIGENYFLPSYFLFISLGFSIGLLYFLARVSKTDLSLNLAINSSLVLMLSSFVGARMFHVIFEHPGYYLAQPTKIFAIHEGGFVFYGGATLAALVTLTYLRLQDQNIGRWLDLFAPVFPIVYGVGRFGTLLSGSGYGLPLDSWWAITYPPGSEAPSGVALHPTPIYSMIWAAFTWTCMWALEQQKGRRKMDLPASSSGGTFAWLVLIHSFGRCVIEQFRDDDRGQLILGWSISTWISAVFFALALIWLLQQKHPLVSDQKRRNPS